METARVRQLHVASLAAAVVLALLGLLLLGGPGDGAARLVVILLLLALVGVEVALSLKARQAPRFAEDPLAGAAPPAVARITIRCKQCGEVFPVEDSGARPLVAACPHCGKSGTIKVRTDAA